MQYMPSSAHYKKADTETLRDGFLLENLFSPGEITLVFSDMDREITGGIVPTRDSIALEAGDKLDADYFAQRREVGVLNIGDEGRIEVDGEVYPMSNRDILYVGRGSENIKFESEDADQPARFYLVSYPAHKSYPTAHASQEDAEVAEIGSEEGSSKRFLYRYIHPDGIQSSQLMMGLTEVVENNVWNTMPAHRHERRSEIYMYFDVGEDDVVFHIMGEPKHTRSLVVREGQAALSPSWSLHAGCGTSNYSFCWVMGGENQEFSDMEGVNIKDLR